jgi:hypothetical protein
MINASRVGAMRAIGQLTRVRLPNIWERSIRTAVIVVVSTGLVMTQVAGVVDWPRCSRWVTRAAVRVIEAVRAAGAWSLGFLIQARVLLPTLITVSVRAAARLIGRVVTGFAHRLTWCRSSLGGLSHWAAETAIAVVGATVRLSEWSSANAAGIIRAVMTCTGRGITVGCAWGRRVVALCMPMDLTRLFALPVQATTQAIEATWVIGRIVLTTSGHAVRYLGLSAWTLPMSGRVWNWTTIDQRSCSVHALARWRASLMASVFLKGMRWPLWAHRPLGLCTGIVCLAIFIVAALFMWPEPPANFMFQSTLERLSQPHPQRTDPRPADRTAAPLAEPSIRDISVLRAAPASQPTRRVTAPPKPLEARAAIPAPSRSRPPVTARELVSDPVPQRSDVTWSRGPLRVPTPEPPPQKEAQYAEAPDASAAIDWLLKSGREASRRSIEGP